MFLVKMVFLVDNQTDNIRDLVVICFRCIFDEIHMIRYIKSGFYCSTPVRGTHLRIGTEVCIEYRVNILSFGAWSILSFEIMEGRNFRILEAGFNIRLIVAFSNIKIKTLLNDNKR